jgi:uncharacterized membrane protein
MIDKLKNYGLWVSFSALLFMILQDLGFTIDPTRWETYFTLVIGILIYLGIVSNPKDGKWFKDKDNSK